MQNRKENRLLILLHTLVSRFLLLLVMLFLLIPTLIFILLPERIRYRNRLCNYLQYFFYWILLKVTLVPVRISGSENIPNTPAVFVANHQSSLDIPLIGRLLKTRPHIWLATNELMTSPILRFIIPRTTVLVDVSTPLSGMRTLLSAISVVTEQNLSTVVFPEGGRFADGQIHDFYAGFVVLAKKVGQPVVPIRIFNLNKVYPRGEFFIRCIPIRVVVGLPMMQAEDESNQVFCERVRAWFLQQGEPEN